MIHIRPAKMDDLPKLLDFEQGVISAERPFDPFIKEEKVTYYDLKNLIESAESEILVAEIDGKIIGSGYAQIRESKPYWKDNSFVYLGFMYVDPSFRGKGINRKIIEELKNWARSKNIPELRLEVYTKNEAAIRAYEKSGFNDHMLEMRINLND
ncbi:MAG: GNAT family N-acetyltransferase [Ginsengibacter sp.]